jgi:hypothetical protein
MGKIPDPLGLFKTEKPPTPPKTQPLPTAGQTDQAGEAEMRKQRRMAGFESTFLTGSLTPKTNKKTVLG